jgi:protein SCO1/2
MIKTRIPTELFDAGARKLQVVMLLLVCGCVAAHQARGQASRISTASDSTLSSEATGKLIKIDNTQVQLPDTRVFTHRGEQVRFYTDLIKGKVVLISYFFSSCTYVCALQADNLSKVQALLGPRLGKDLFLISISMDPERDTPQKLKYLGRSLRPGWTLVSSNTPEMNGMLKAFTGFDPGPKDTHTSLVFIGNDRTGKWMTTDGLRDPRDLVKFINEMAAEAGSK